MVSFVLHHFVMRHFPPSAGCASSPDGTDPNPSRTSMEASRTAAPLPPSIGGPKRQLPVRVPPLDFEEETEGGGVDLSRWDKAP